MTMRTSIVAVFGCDSALHQQGHHAVSSFAAKTQEQAIANALAAGWRQRTVTPLGVPVQMWDCPKCARAAATKEAMQ